MVAQRMRDYELVMIISPEANEEEIAATVERVANLITERGGSILDQAIWGLRRLAYPIQRFHEGNYVLTRFSADAGNITQLDENLKASDDILRHLTTRMDRSAKLKLEQLAASAEAAEPEEPAELAETTEPEEPAESAETTESEEPAETI